MQNKAIKDFHYILSRMYDRVTYAQAVVLYNQLRSKDNSVSDEKIIMVANLLRQKENVVNE